MSAPARVRLPRGRRGLVATLTAVVGVLICAAAAAEAISLASRKRALLVSTHDVARFGRQNHLGNRTVLIVAIVVFVLGALLVLAVVVPARRRVVALVDPDPSVAAGLTKRSFHRTLAAAAASVDGVSSAKVTGRRRLRVRADTPLRDVTGLADQVDAGVRERLDQLGPDRQRTVRVQLRPRES